MHSTNKMVDFPNTCEWVCGVLGENLWNSNTNRLKVLYLNNLDGKLEKLNLWKGRLKQWRSDLKDGHQPLLWNRKVQKMSIL